MSYKYQSDDQSMLLPFLMNYIVRPLYRIVPRSIPANMITLFANACNYIALALAVSYGPEWRPNFFIIPALFMIYMIGDHLDGLQAKTTKTGSPLGEFLDHYLDTFNAGIVILVTCLMFGLRDPLWVAIVTFSILLAQGAVFYQEYRTGIMKFEALGHIEGIVLLSLLFLLGAHPVVYTWLISPIIFNLSPFLLFVIFSIGSGLWTTYSTYLRIGNFDRGWYLFALGLTLIAVPGAFFFSYAELFIAMMLHAGIYVGKLMRSHLVDHRIRRPDIGAPIVFCVIGLLRFAFGGSPEFLQSAFFVPLAYQAAFIIWNSFRIVYALRHHWYWWNPRST
jgi:ethanolaminephosphotransferase